MNIILCVSIVLIILFILSRYLKNQVAICKSTTKLFGKTVIITGGTRGTGLEVAKDFARRGAKVIVACPYEIEGYTALARIAIDSGNHNVYFKMLNLASLASVRKFVEQVLEKETRLDILVNNASVGIPKDVFTDDGIHYTMQVNYYGHFLLTLLLLPLLKRTGTKAVPSRIINTTSNLYEHATLDVDNYNKIRYWSKAQIYANSKLSVILFARELSKMLANYNVVVNCAVPGVVTTHILYYRTNEYIAPFMNLLVYIFFRTPLQGAQNVIYAALDEKTGHANGEVFINCKLTDIKIDYDNLDVKAKKLWEQSTKLVQFTECELQGRKIS